MGVMGQQSIEASLLGKPSRRWSKALSFTLALIATITFVGLGLGLGGALSYENTLNERDKHEGSAEVVRSERAVVAADDGRCSEIGVSVLQKGGHAVDAVVATALCIGVVNPAGSGIGGGAFMVVRSSSTSKTQAFDSRETAPSAASENMYENNLDAKYSGALSMGVPGELAGLYKAWLEHGRLPWQTLLEPAIKLAKNGFVVAPYLASAISKSSHKIMNDVGLKRVYAPAGKLLKDGDICYNVELGRTLEVVAEEGPKAFYDGEIGEKLIGDVRKAGGVLTMEDLRNYRVDVSEAVSVRTMGYTVLGMPPPSSGTVGLSLVLNILDSYKSSNAAKGPLGLHRLIEAMKHMYAVRMNLGDPDFENINRTISDMLSPAFAHKIRQRIFDNTTFPPQYYLPRWSQLKDEGTSHICIVDADRNAVSMTTTVNYGFGAGVMSTATGIIINNEMGDFSVPSETSPDSLPPSPVNFIKPNKRPLSSMTPLVVLKDNQLAAVLGAGGGMYIIPAVIQVFLNHFILGMKPLAAVQSPRVYHELIPNIVYYENWTVIDGEHIELSNERKRFLEERGHELEAKAGGAVCQLIVQNLQNPIQKSWRNRKMARDNIFRGTLIGVSDPRKDGKPAAM